MLGITPHNLKAVTISGALAVGYVGACSWIGKRQYLPERLSRKLMHIGTGSIYLCTFPLYDATAAAPWICAAVPFLASVNFALVGAGLIPDYLHITSGATRTGSKQELLRGPLLYGLIHSILTVACWRSPAVVVPLAVLCGGDGMAEVIGRSVDSPKLPYNKDKSVAGSLACFAFGAANAFLLTKFLAAHNTFSSAVMAASGSGSLLSGIVICALIGAVVESLPLPVNDVDNVTVPLAVAIASKAILGA